MGFLAGCAILGFLLGLKGAMPRNVDPDMNQGPLASTQSGVVVEATAQENTAPLPPEEKKDEEVAAADEKAEETKPAVAEAPKPAAPAAAPKEEAPPTDPVGELLQPAPAPAPPPDTLY